MTTFHIYHSYPDMNFHCKEDKFMYKPVGDVEADSLYQALEKAFNTELGKRTTTIGDIIMPEEHRVTCYLITVERGLKEVPAIKWIYYIDWRLIDSMRNALEQVGEIVNRVTGIKGLPNEPPDYISREITVTESLKRKGLI